MTKNISSNIFNPVAKYSMFIFLVCSSISGNHQYMTPMKLYGLAVIMVQSAKSKILLLSIPNTTNQNFKLIYYNVSLVIFLNIYFICFKEFCDKIYRVT